MVPGEREQRVRVEDVISIVVDLQKEHAQAALARPAGKEAFDYGAASGRYLAYQTVLDAINEALEAEARETRD